MCVNTHITQTDKPRRPGHLAQEVVPSLHPVHSRPVRSWETKSEWILWSSYCYIQPLHQTEIYRNHDFSERTHSIIMFATCTRNRDNSDGDQVRVGLHTSLDSNNLKRWKVLLETSRLIFSFFYSCFFFFIRVHTLSCFSVKSLTLVNMAIFLKVKWRTLNTVIYIPCYCAKFIVFDFGFPSLYRWEPFLRQEHPWQWTSQQNYSFNHESTE